MKAWWHLKAVCGYWVARRLFAWRWLVAQPRAWAWMQGQYARMAALGHVEAQSFYGHLLLFRGQGFGVRSEALRLLKAAGEAGDSKAAYQVGRQLLAGDVQEAADAAQAAHWWALAAQAGHALAAHQLAELYRCGQGNLPADTQAAERWQQRASELGL